MKFTLGVITSITLSTLTSATLTAAEYQSQVDLSHSYQEDGGATLNSTTIGIVHYLTPIATAKTPFREDAFLARTSSLSGSVNYSQASFDNHFFDKTFDGRSANLGYQSRTKNRALTWGLSASYGKGDSDDSRFYGWAAILGLYLNPNTRIGVVYGKTKNEFGNLTSTSDNYHLTGRSFLAKDKGRGIAIGGSINYSNSDYYFNFDSSYYLSQRNSIDLHIGKTDNQLDLGLGTTHYFSPVLSAGVKLSTSHYRDHTPDPGIDANMAYRF